MTVEFALRQLHLLADGLAEHLLLEPAQAAVLVALDQVGIGASMHRQNRNASIAFERSRNAAGEHDVGERSYAVIQGTLGEHLVDRSSHPLADPLDQLRSQPRIGNRQNLAPQGNRQIGVRYPDLSPSQVRE
jgi:hypothetical protein